MAEGLVYPSEVVDLLIALMAIPMLVRVARTRRPADVKFFAIGYFTLVAALVVTIAEGFFAPEVLNLLEHCLYSVSGIAFLVAVVRMPGAEWSRGGDVG